MKRCFPEITDGLKAHLRNPCVNEHPATYLVGADGVHSSIGRVAFGEERAGLVDVLALDWSHLVLGWTEDFKKRLGILGQLRITFKALERWGLKGLWRIRESERIFLIIKDFGEPWFPSGVSCSSVEPELLSLQPLDSADFSAPKRRSR